MDTDTILDLVRAAYERPCRTNEDVLQLYKLTNLVDSNRERICELQYRTDALEWLMSELSNETSIRFAKTMVMRVRFNTSGRHMNGYVPIDGNYTLDIALKSESPSKKYIKMMHQLLAPYTGNLDISAAIWHNS